MIILGQNILDLGPLWPTLYRCMCVMKNKVRVVKEKHLGVRYAIFNCMNHELVFMAEKKGICIGLNQTKHEHTVFF